MDGIDISLGFRKHKKRGYDRRRESFVDLVLHILRKVRTVLCVDGAFKCILSVFLFTPTFREDSYFLILNVFDCFFRATFREDCQFLVGQICVQLPQ